MIQGNWHNARFEIALGSYMSHLPTRSVFLFFFKEIAVRPDPVSLKDIFMDTPIEIPLVPQTPLADPIPIPVLDYKDYVIAWTEQESGDIVTTSWVEDPDGDTIPRCSFDASGDYTFQASLHWPFDTEYGSGFRGIDSNFTPTPDAIARSESHPNPKANTGSMFWWRS